MINASSVIVLSFTTLSVNTIYCLCSCCYTVNAVFERDVVEYLWMFSYLPSDSDAITVNDLELVLLSFQQLSFVLSLQPDGVTLDLMSRPRCLVTDWPKPAPYHKWDLLTVSCFSYSLPVSIINRVFESWSEHANIALSWYWTFRR